MDSLLANYASSDDDDDEEEEEQQQQPQKLIPSTSSKTTSSSSSSLFSALPQPKSSSSSLFQSLPPPKQPSSDTLTDTPSSAFSNLTETSSLPKPKSQIQEQPKRVVQFKPPIIPLPKPTKHEDSEDEDDDEEEELNKRKKMESSVQTPSVKSFLSSIPAPRNSATLGVQASSGSGRRSIIETETDSPAPPASSSGGSASYNNVPVDQNGVDYENYQYPVEQYDSYGNYSWGATTEAETGADTGTAMATYSYGNSDDGYASYGAYGNYGQYANNWDEEGSAATVQETPASSSDSILKFTGKRGRKDIPVEVIEVKQDELIKNRPREDQVKLTGLAFGPTYQVLSRFVVLSCLDFDNLMYICRRRK